MVDGFSAAAREKKVRLAMAPPAGPLSARCDRDRIIQVLANLIENAIKFSPAGGEIVAAVRAEGADRVSIDISDTGPGVPDEHKERIFSRFHQVGPPGTSSGGVGLGLAICREIVAAHHGDLSVADHPDGGSVFSVTLPAAGAETSRRATS